MDPTTLAWQDKYSNLAASFNNFSETPPTHITHMYLDCFPHAKLCYRTDINHAGPDGSVHPSGGGNYWIKGVCQLLIKCIIMEWSSPPMKARLNYLFRILKPFLLPSGMDGEMVRI